MSVKFRGVHVNSLDAVWKTGKMQIIPTPKTSAIEVPEADSQYDYSEVNEDSRLHYQDRIFDGTLTVKGKGMHNLSIALNKLAIWLMGGWGELEIDYLPGIIWTAKIENLEGVQADLNRIGSTHIYFRVKPFGKLCFNSQSGGIPLNSNIPIESSLRIDDDLKNIFNFVNSSSLQVYNYGNWHTKPIISIIGTFSSIQITCNGKIITYTASCSTSDLIIIDCAKLTATKNSVPDDIHLYGDCFEFKPGVNNVSITSNGTGKIGFLFDYYFIWSVI